jgi:hypothetical protein
MWHARLPEAEFVSDQDNSGAVSPELNLQCLQCGSVTTGNVIAIAECPRCGALDYHVFRGFISLDETTHHRRLSAPDNKDVIKKMIELVQSKA